MKYRLFFLTLIGIVVFSCSESYQLEAESEFDITGFWVNQSINDTIYAYDKSSHLKEGQYCFGFQENEEFVERKNAGWCGTPPISYADFEGTWSLTDSIVDISVAFWGGTASYKWKIISLNHQQLQLIVIESNHEMEE